jgi:hypothetical protein
LDVAAKMLIGAGLGAAFGYLLGRARCGARACNVRANMTLFILSGAFFGAAMGWYLATR